jgi:hypothetical protein
MTSEPYIEIDMTLETITRKIKTYGVIANLIDYGVVVKDGVYPLGEDVDKVKEKIDMHLYVDVDMNLLIDYLLLNNAYLYKQIDPIDGRPFSVKNVFDIVRAVYRISPDIYRHSKELLKYDIDEKYIDDDKYTHMDIKKNHIFISLIYELLRMIQIYHTDEYIKIISDYYGKSIEISKMFDYELIKEVVENKSDLRKVIDIIQKT